MSVREGGFEEHRWWRSASSALFHVKSLIIGCEGNGRHSSPTQGQESCIPLIKANRQQLPGISGEIVNNHAASNNANRTSNTLLKCSRCSPGSQLLWQFSVMWHPLDGFDLPEGISAHFNTHRDTDRKSFHQPKCQSSHWGLSDVWLYYTFRAIMFTLKSLTRWKVEVFR